ncbi:MAG: hypothetical protein IPK18_00500 [Sphingobacteriales bacterium]|nr:MAG: hypothetical protein IPK18_00500 [Sphingobacteriales bacterium]
MNRYFFLLIVLIIKSLQINANSIYIEQTFEKNSIVDHTIQDASNLLQSAGITVSNQQKNVDFKIILQKLDNNKSYATLYESNTKETQAFNIKLEKKNNQNTIYIQSLSYKGIANGIYYLLQNKFGFQFYHAKEIKIPNLKSLDLNSFDEYITPRFDKIGFHIHAMHPLEITEALLDETTPNGKQEIKTYIDWLCRNGQNYFEFNLLSSIKLETWVPYMKDIVDYAHQRGIICGADLSFHMIQQRAFQLYKKFPASFRKREKQIKQNIETLMQIPWDVWNVELATTEFTHQNQEELYAQQKMLYDNLSKYKVKLTSRKHVVKDENLISNAKSMKTKFTDMDSAYALFVHTVMFYGLNDSATPVYRNKDFSHLRNLLIESNQYRDTWYFPESAYWITFDNSVPMFLTPYLSTRLDDILYSDSLNINGHITFTSGWEWNYWLIDWSIARWCWNEANQQQKPFEYIEQLIEDKNIINFVQKVDSLQQLYIKDKQLIKVLTAQTITDEIGGKLNLEFHPRPEYAYKYILNDANKTELQFIKNKYINNLEIFISEYNKLRNTIQVDVNNKLISELINSLDITTLRAEHRKNTLAYIIEKRLKDIDNIKYTDKLYLNKANNIRKQALSIVASQQRNYRYDISNVASEKESKTVYNFGYLYPVSNLHFWEREEWQAENNKWKFWNKNIWDVLKIIGIKK